MRRYIYILIYADTESKGNFIYLFIYLLHDKTFTCSKQYG